jgi:hypothetical protein
VKPRYHSALSTTLSGGSAAAGGGAKCWHEGIKRRQALICFFLRNCFLVHLIHGSGIVGPRGAKKPPYPYPYHIPLQSGMRYVCFRI